MNSVRGQLYRLFKPEAGISTPLLSKIDRNPLKSNRLVTEKMKKSRRHSLRRSFTSDMTDEHLLGEQINDWHLRQFELCLHTCEFRYRSKSRDLGDDESRFVPGMKSIGFIQAETEIDKGPTISTVDVDAKTGQRLILYTITVLFSLEDKISTAVGRSWVTYSVVIGHDDHVERDRWYDAILKLIEEKRSMQLAWKLHLIQRNQESDSKHKTWEEARQGKLALTINHKQHKTSRLRNGKVFQDLPGVFKKYAIHRNEWKTAHGVMRIQDVTSALQDLGLNPPDWHAARMLEDLQKTPQRSDCPGFLDLDGFEIIFKSTYDELITSPSDEMMEKLMEIMNRSNNPFLQLLSKEEKENLVEGKDADGRNVCVCRKYLKGTVIVNQGDEGHSMFIIIEGQLSVVVTFGKGPDAMQKEVAKLPEGAVMGEMSLVLGKPRSATCVVASDKALLAEVTRSAVTKLLESRPSLSRELQDMVIRRDTANILAAGSATAMAAYRSVLARAGNRAENAAEPSKVVRGDQPRPPKSECLIRRLQTRSTRVQKTLQSRPSTALSQPMMTSKLPEFPESSWSHDELAPQVKQRSGRWVKFKDGYMLSFDTGLNSVS